VHPAELTGTLPSRQPVIAEIEKAFPCLPRNVFLVRPESRISTYVAMSRCDSVIIYGTKTGVELAASGIPVIVAGEAWIRGKGVTFDAESEAAYFQLLDALPFSTALDPERRDRALRYAYHFFFRRMIPLGCVKEKNGWPPFEVSVDDINELKPGRYRGLDVICDGILAGSPFVLRSEQDSQMPTA
jgi:hypothetical protein